MGEYPLFEKSFQNYSVFYYFEGYGLYEDTDFTLRVSKTGKLYLNTAKLNHHHDASGRPNQYQYGKMWCVGGTYGQNPNHHLSINLNGTPLLFY
jgi:hypothetical protein